MSKSKRTKAVLVKMTPEEFEAVRLAAERLGMTPTTYVRAEALRASRDDG